MKTLKNNWLSWLILITSFAGMLNAWYLTLQHYRGLSPNCSIIHGCDIVTSSAYSTVFGIPLALFGLVFYIVILLLTFSFMQNESHKKIQSLWLVTGMGIITSTILVCLQIFIIEAFCQYCLISAIETVILFFAVSILNSRYQSTDI